MDLYTIRQQLNMGIPLTKIKLRVTDYSRVSTEHIEQKKSLNNQIEYFDTIIKNNPNWIYIKGYVDDGISGTTDFKRTDFMKMIEDAKKDKFDLIITKEISRFSRNTLDSIKYTRELLSYGVAVLFVGDNINTALPDSELRLTIMASMAQDEIRRLSERVKFGMNASIKKGNILGNDLMYGYKKDKLSGNLIIIEKEAELVRKLFELYAIEEKSLNAIAKEFNNNQQYKKWYSSTLSRMIKNVKYKGYYCGKKTEIIDYMTKKVKYIPKEEWIMYKDNKKIPPIVSEALWEKANMRLKNRKVKTKSQNRYLFSSKIYCKIHNELFYRRKNCKSTDDISWFCSKYLKEGKKICQSPNIREKELYQILSDISNNILIDMKKIENLLIKIYKDKYKHISVSSEIDKLKTKKQKINLKKDRLLELNVEKAISTREFKEQNNKYNLELSNINNKIKKLEAVSKENIVYLYKNLIKIISEEISKINITEVIIKKLLNKINVSTINNDQNNIKLEIYLKRINEYSDDKIFTEKTYEFKRGYNTTSTKRYVMKYQVICYIQD